jgi:hypothetical protein
MHLITLFGPPAVGKYTVGRLLSERIGYKLFHNHLTVNLARSLFDYGVEEFFPLMADLRLRCFEAVSRSSIRGLIFTCAFVFPNGEEFADRIVETIEGNGGRCDFVRLTCPVEELVNRVGNQDRRDLGKIVEPEKLADAIESFDLLNILRGRDSLVLDTSQMRPSDICDSIIANVVIDYGR